MGDSIIRVQMQANHCTVEVPDAWLCVKISVNEKTKRVLRQSRSKTQSEKQQLSCTLALCLQDIIRIDAYDGDGEVQYVSQQYRREGMGLVLIEISTYKDGVRIEKAVPKIESIEVDYDVYDPLVELIDAFSLQDFEETQPACTLCKTRIAACPFYRVQVPIYLGDAYLTDRTAYACSGEHMFLILPEQITPPGIYNSEDLPSEEGKPGWIYAFFNHPTYPRDTRRSGKWLIFVSCKKIDTAWLLVKTALERGELGRIAKVARAVSATRDEKDDLMKQVICVYTYDYADRADTLRIRQALRNIGCTRKIAYKADEDTRRLRYRINTPGRISKYYE